LDDRGSIPASNNDVIFSPCNSVHTGSGARTDSYPIDTGGLLRRG